VSARDPIAEEVRALAALNLEDLRAEWRRRWNEAPPQLRTRELLALALAHRIQTRQHGDLPGPLKRRVAELGRRFAQDRDFSPVPGPDLKPGSSLIKAWRGVRHEVRVTPDGFSYRGDRFGSLSEVAQHITGTKWNGRLFFGLTERRR
jgi:hypothetical protein